MDLNAVPIRLKNFLKGVSAKAEDFSRRMPLKCLYPNCFSKPVDCHSQQCNGLLSAIANEKRMVIVPSKDAKGSMSRLLEGMRDTRGFHLVHINRASIFKGFCQKHDTELFAGIETRPLVVNDVEQVVALHRRVIALEVRNCLELLGSLNVQKYLTEQKNFFSKGLNNEILLAEERLKSIKFYEWKPLWCHEPEKQFCYAWRVLPKKLSISLASIITPDLDDSIYSFYRNVLSMVGVDITPRLGFSLTIIPQDYKTHIIMVWNKIFDPVVDRYRNRLMSLDLSEVEVFLNECVFCLSEDWCMNPNAWNAIPQSVRNNLIQKLSMEDFYDRAKDIPRIITI